MQYRMKIQITFWRDHKDRDLPTPPAHKMTSRHVEIDPTHPYMADLIADARYYADPVGMCPSVSASLGRAARRLVALYDYWAFAIPTEENS